MKNKLTTDEDIVILVEIDEDLVTLGEIDEDGVFDGVTCTHGTSPTSSTLGKNPATCQLENKINNS